MQTSNEERKLLRASTVKRLINYLTDIIVFSILASAIMAFFYPKASEWINDPNGLNIKDQLMISFFYGLYMSVMEALLKGKTIGKLITRTRVVNADGSFISTQTAFVRGLCRLVPFEQLSALGIPSIPWHDRWSGTIVTNDDSLRKPL